MRPPPFLSRLSRIGRGRVGAGFFTLVLFAACDGPPPPSNDQIRQVERALSEEIPEPSSDAVEEARESNLDDMRTALKPSAATAFDELRARLPGDLIVYSSSTSPSQVLATATGDLLPPVCRPILATATPDFEEAVRCFLREQPSLMSHSADADQGPAPEILVTQNAPGLLPGPPEQYLRVEQMHRGHPVDERSMAFVFIDGRLASASGRFVGTAGFQAPLVDEAFLENEVRRQFGDQARTEGLVFNPESGELELRVFDGELEHRLNAEDGALRSSRSRLRAVPVSKNINAYTFPPGTYLGVSSTTELMYLPMTCTGLSGWCDGVGSGTCKYHPNAQVYNADRVVGVQLEDWLGQVTTAYEDDPCGSSSVFNQWPWSNTYQLEHYAGSARRAFDQAADVLQNSESFFWAYPRTPDEFKLRVSEVASTNGGDYGYDNGKVIRLFQDPWPTGRANARSLSTIAHEFGHYVHDTINQMQGQQHVEEAWAAAYALRMAVHNRFVAWTWPNVGYYTSLVTGWTWQLQSVIRKGEYILDRYPNPSNCAAYPDPSGNTCADWIYYGTAYVCPSNIYNCGAPIWTTYWILAHDQCRISFMSCADGQDIIQHNGGYQTSAWRLANSTFAYAIWKTSPTGNAQEFMTHVADRYAYFRSQGYLSQADEDRVRAVLASQCVGPTQNCSTGKHRLPGSPLPSSQTTKHALFKEAETGQLWNSAGIATAVNGASGDQYVVFGDDGWLALTFNIVQTGTYRVHFVLKPKNSLYDEISLYDNTTGTWKNVGPMNQPNYSLAWDWRTETNGDADLTFTTAGSNIVWLSAEAGHIGGFILDAVWLEKL